jgi:hypothetical protein
MLETKKTSNNKLFRVSLPPFVSHDLSNERMKTRVEQTKQKTFEEKVEKRLRTQVKYLK